MSLAGGVAPNAKVRELSNALYATCRSQDDGKLFTQEDLQACGVVPSDDLSLLMACVNLLGSDGLFKLMTKDGRPCWKVVSAQDAAKYRDLNSDEAIVYGYIESAGREGIWTRLIRSKSNLHHVPFTRSLKTLEQKGLIKPTQSAKYPTRKLYILSHLQPLEEISGGPFFTDGSIDEEFVHQLCRWVEVYVQGRSWYNSYTISRRKKTSTTTGDEATKGSVKEKIKRTLPMPPGYIGYPKVPEITKAMNEAGLSSITMKETEVRQLLDILCWDGRLMKVMGGQAFKSVLQPSSHEGQNNGLVEAPCGRCPVFDLCEDGGPVNARTCTYFQEWLEI